MHGEKRPENITRIDAKKDLGIWLSPNLSFSLHLEKSAQKAFAVLRMIRRTFSRITRTDFQILYGAYVRPLLEYANPVVYSGRVSSVSSELLRKWLPTSVQNTIRHLFTRVLALASILPRAEKLKSSASPFFHFTFSRITRTDFQILYGAYVRPLLEYANPVVYSGRVSSVSSELLRKWLPVSSERQPLNDKNKTDPGNLGKSLDPVYQSVNP
ncbi:hypothetical protein CLF_102952 [Clonorchis sinensis]|uniref:Uncharacterized protein n=1 Tax=Clonorchis sinensis TaxID=79923 RepID=G7Y8V1_CLOSI|nr:hypothetical protein CLF_102952 [Clonorchis sinensis]